MINALFKTCTLSEMNLLQVLIGVSAEQTYLESSLGGAARFLVPAVENKQPLNRYCCLIQASCAMPIVGICHARIPKVGFILQCLMQCQRWYTTNVPDRNKCSMHLGGCLFGANNVSCGGRNGWRRLLQ